ncbi:hypothetical protein [Kitasatospora griseola]
MTDASPFGGYLARLLDHRGTRPDELAAASGVPEPELRAVLAGTLPTVAQLDLLAPVLGFHAADLHVMAGLVVPEVLAYRRSGGMRSPLIAASQVLSPDRTARVLELVDRLPREPWGEPPGPAQHFDPRVSGFGAVLVNLLWWGRNLRAHDTTWALQGLTCVGLSLATVPAIGRGSALTPETAAGIGVVLGLAPGDVLAMAGPALPDRPFQVEPRADETASLLWRCRYLTGEQAKSVGEAAQALLLPVPDGAPPEEWNRVYSSGGVWWGGPKEWTAG